MGEPGGIGESPPSAPLGHVGLRIKDVDRRQDKERRLCSLAEASLEKHR